MSLDKEIFKGKTLSDLFGEIYDNSKETKGQVKALIGELKPLIENIGDATAKDIEQLIYLAQEKVEELKKIRLQLEVKIIGENVD